VFRFALVDQGWSKGTDPGCPSEGRINGLVLGVAGASSGVSGDELLVDLRGWWGVAGVWPIGRNSPAVLERYVLRDVVCGR
jgi:hypothetical protein